MNGKHAIRAAGLLAMGLITATALVGCPTTDFPPNPQSYDLGFAAGFAKDSWYWDGYFDGYDTVGVQPIYYRGDEIPYYETPPYDAGYWDGIWYAYNDGYFVDYHYAFIVGFSEGYDNAYWPDYLDFLATDVHIEQRNGGWSDGYNDGFSEGRIFGANDFEQGLPFDWRDALQDYEAGTDLYFVEVDLGTGAYGPVILYEYGTDPHTLKAVSGDRGSGRAFVPSIRAALSKAAPGETSIYRVLTAEARNSLDVLSEVSLRSDRELLLDTTWLERVESYLGAKDGQRGLKSEKEVSLYVRIRTVTP